MARIKGKRIFRDWLAILRVLSNLFTIKSLSFTV